jgi:hypothetical protein
MSVIWESRRDDRRDLYSSRAVSVTPEPRRRPCRSGQGRPGTKRAGLRRQAPCPKWSQAFVADSFTLAGAIDLRNSKRDRLMISPDAREVRLAYRSTAAFLIPLLRHLPQTIGCWAVKPISRWQWNDGYGGDCGPSQATTVGVLAAQLRRPRPRSLMSA